VKAGWRAARWRRTEWRRTRWRRTRWRRTRWQAARWRSAGWRAGRWHAARWHAARWHAVLAGAAATFAAAAAVATSAPAAAEPATTLSYPAWASATGYDGLAFDACSAPSLAAMRAWRRSPYHAIGVYVGGQNRTCAQPALTRRWVGAVSLLGWRLIPIFKGRQPPCGGKAGDLKIFPAVAASEGTWAADNAWAQVMALGMIRGSAIYYDMEAYATGDAPCRDAVLRFLSAWTSELHRLGYVSGVYENLRLGAPDLAGVYDSPAYARPDALWIARYDQDRALTGWAGIGDGRWAVHQRAKQFSADLSEAHGGVTLNIDADHLDAPVATIAFRYRVTSGRPVAARSGPGRSYPAVRTYRAGVTVVCQAPGSSVGTTTVWDKLTDGSYVTDARVDTPSGTGYSAPATRCRYPYQVTAGHGANQRGGPSVSAPLTGQLPGGSLAWVVCQRTGTPVGGTRIWYQTSHRRWVAGNYAATPGPAGFGQPAPRC
jgi:glycoside hydrolase-like protein